MAIIQGGEYIKMKVAIIITSGYYTRMGGAEVFAREVAEHLAKEGATVDVITQRLDKSLSKLETINNVTVHRIKIGRIRYLSFVIGFFRLLWYMLKLNRIRDYDLIHSVGDGLPSHVGTLIKKLKRKPHLITIQGGNITPGFRNNLSGRMLRKLQQWSFNNADVVHVISRKLRHQVEELGAHDVVVIPNGVDASIFRPMNKGELRKRHGFSQDEKIIISAARLIPRKGIDYLIRAAAMISEHLPNLRLLIIGDGVQRAELGKLILQLKLGDKAQILGVVAHDQIPQYLNMADVFVIPSLYEPLGIVTIEAMACGVPVIGTNVDGIPDVIEDGENGILVPPGDDKRLAEAIMKLLADEETRNRFAREGLETVKQRFLWETVLARMKEVYSNLTGLTGEVL